MKCLYSNSFTKLDSFYDQRIEVMLSESIQEFRPKDIFIHQKAILLTVIRKKIRTALENDHVETILYK